MESYIELARIYQVYPYESLTLIQFIIFQQIMFVAFNWVLFPVIPVLFLIIVDVNWQMFLTLYITQRIHYIWLKDQIEN